MQPTTRKNFELPFSLATQLQHIARLRRDSEAVVIRDSLSVYLTAESQRLANWTSPEIKAATSLRRRTSRRGRKLNP